MLCARTSLAVFVMPARRILDAGRLLQGTVSSLPAFTVENVVVPSYVPRILLGAWDSNNAKFIGVS